MRCEHEHDDGAYVLGALSPAERTAYERHLATCSFCREAVRDIATLPDLLSRLDAAEFAQLVDPGPAPRAEHRRRRTGPARRVRILSSAAAVVLIAVVGAGLLLMTRPALPSPNPPGPATAMTPVGAGSLLSASVRLTSRAGGTRVDLACSLGRGATSPYTLRLVAYGPDDQKEQIGSWQAAPGTDFPMPALTHFGAGSLSRIEVLRYDGTVLLTYDVP
jgi:hypothetical protein